MLLLVVAVRYSYAATSGMIPRGVAGSLDSRVSVTRAAWLCFVAMRKAHLNPCPKQQEQRIAEQNVDIPVVGGGGAGGSLSGFLPRQHYSVTAEQIVDNPVSRPGGAEVFKAYTLDRVQQRFRSRSPSFRSRSLRFSASPKSSASSSVSPGQAGEWFFSHFSHRKKSAKIPRTEGSGLGAQSSSWTP